MGINLLRLCSASFFLFILSTSFRLISNSFLRGSGLGVWSSWCVIDDLAKIFFSPSPVGAVMTVAPSYGVPVDSSSFFACRACRCHCHSMHRCLMQSVLRITFHLNSSSYSLREAYMTMAVSIHSSRLAMLCRLVHLRVSRITSSRHWSFSAVKARTITSSNMGSVTFSKVKDIPDDELFDDFRQRYGEIMAATDRSLQVTDGNRQQASDAAEARVKRFSHDAENKTFTSYPGTMSCSLCSVYNVRFGGRGGWCGGHTAST